MQQQVSDLNLTTSEIFAQYNRAKAAARKRKFGKGSATEQVGRVNRALGILVGEKVRPYQTSVEKCSCPDATIGRFCCKHRKAAMMVRRIIRGRVYKAQALTKIKVARTVRQEARRALAVAVELSEVKQVGREFKPVTITGSRIIQLAKEAQAI